MFSTSMLINGRKVLAAATKVAVSIEIKGSDKFYTFKDKSVLVVKV